MTVWQKANDSALLQRGGLIDFVYKVPYRIGTGTEISNNVYELAWWAVWVLKKFIVHKEIYVLSGKFAGFVGCLHTRGMPRQRFYVVFAISYGLNCIVQTH